MIEALVAVADLIGSAVGEADGAGAIGGDLPQIEFVVEDDSGVVFGPASDAKGRLLLDGPIRFAVDERGLGALGDVDDGMGCGIDGPVVVVVEIEKVAAAGTGLEVIIVAEPLLNVGTRAGSDVDERYIGGGASDGPLHGVGGPVGGDGGCLVLQRSDFLVQILAEGNKGVVVDVPSGKHIFLAVIFGVEFLLGHDFGVVPVPYSRGGRLVFVFVLIFVRIFALVRILVFCGVGRF